MAEAIEKRKVAKKGRACENCEHGFDIFIYIDIGLD